MNFKKRVTKSIALALVGFTLATPLAGTVSAMEKGNVSNSIEISSDFKRELLRELENEKQNVIITHIKEDEIPKEAEPRNKYLLRLVKDFLVKNKSKIIGWLRKVPGIDSKLADTFNKYFSTFINILDNWDSGVEGAVYKFWRMFFSPSTAQTATNVTMFILSFFIPGL